MIITLPVQLVFTHIIFTHLFMYLQLDQKDSMEDHTENLLKSR